MAPQFNNRLQAARAFARKFSKEFFLAFILAVVAAVGIEGWKVRTERRAIETNLSAVATLIVFDKDQAIIGQASGFFINSEGLLVTNAHVLNGMTTVRAKLSSGAFYELQDVKNVDKVSDIALLHFDARQNPAVVGLGNSDNIQPGEKVFAIGTPHGQEGTVSEGNISNRNRDFNGRKLIQFTAPISPGSSGGGLFNNAGEVIGITSASLNISQGPQAGTTQNLNYAVPINELKETIEGKQASSDTSAQGYYIRGISEANQKKWDEAILSYSRAIEIDSAFVQAYMDRADAYFRIRNYRLEAQDYLDAVLLDSSNSEATYLLGTALEDMGEYPNAQQAYARALQLDPQNVELLHDYALLCLATGDEKRASALDGELLKLNPGWGRIIHSILRRPRR